MSEQKQKLRLITYLSPGIPVEVFEIIRDYLEEVTGREGSLIYESRFLGPPPDRVDPFTADEVDIGFMESSDYLRLVSRKNKNIELCQAGACHIHRKNADQPVYYADVIVGKEKNSFKEFHDLRGHSLAYSNEKSVSGSLILLEHLKKMGFNASFFGDVRESGSHLNSIQMVLDNIVDTAVIDSNVLQAFLARYPHRKTDLHVLTSLGPLPTYPIVFNSRLPDEIKNKITESLLEMSKKPEWKTRLAVYNVSKFVPCDVSLYGMENDLCAAVKGMSVGSTYY